MRSLAFLGAALLAAGCALPASDLTQVTVEGRILDAAGAPLPGAQVNLLLPAQYGLSGIHARAGKAGGQKHEDQVRSVLSAEDGSFRAEFDPVTYTITIWLLPPLWDSFQHPPGPQIGVRVEGIDEVCLLRIGAEGCEVRAHRLPDRKPLEEPPTFLVEASAERVEIPGPDGDPIEVHRVRLLLRRRSESP